MLIRFSGTLRGDLVEVGRIVKPQGIRGEVKIVPWGLGLEDLAGCNELVLFDRAGRSQAFQLLAWRPQGGALVARLAGVNDRDQAESLRDRVVAMASAGLPPLGADEIYWYRLEGLPARTAEGREVGRVADYLLTGAHPILVIVDDQGREYLVPAHAEFMSVQSGPDGEPAWLLLTPPPGLLDV